MSLKNVYLIKSLFSITLHIYDDRTSSFRLDAKSTPDTPEPDRATRPAAAAAAAAALSGLMAPVGQRQNKTRSE